MEVKVNMKSNSKIFSIIFISIFILSIPGQVSAKKGKKKGKSVYEFEIVTEVKRTPVKNQYRTGTCWCFSTISFLESELLRKGKEEIDLSEMYVVRHTYPHKAMNYIRMHGMANHSQGGQSHDVIDQIRRYGIVPENMVWENTHLHEVHANAYFPFKYLVSRYPCRFESIMSYLDAIIGYEACRK